MNVCPQCHTTGEEGQRFCRTCGTGLVAREEPAETAAAPAQPATEPQPLVTGPESPAEVVEGPGRTKSTGRAMAVIGGSVAVLAVGLGGLLGFRMLFPGGGAGSPEEAATSFINSLADQDPVGALSMVSPGEAEGLDGLMKSLQSRLAEGGLASSKDGKLMDALSIELGDVRVTVDEEGEDAAIVNLQNADVDVTLDSGKLPERYAALAARYPDGKTWKVDLAEALADELGDGDDAFVTAVREDGRWYLSPLATVGEYAARSLDDSADYRELSEEPIEPVVGDDPEEAVENVVDAIDSNDMDELLATMPADEVGVLRAFSGVVEDALDEEVVNLTGDLTDIATRTEEVGDYTKLTFEDLQVEATAETYEDYSTGTLSVDGPCLAIDGDEACIDRTFSRYTGIDSWFVMLRSEGDGYQVDPVATLVAYADQIVTKTPEDVALRALELEGMIAPAATVKAGESTEIDLGESGAAVVQVEAKKGDVLVAKSDDDGADFTWYDPDHSVDISGWGPFHAVNQAGTYRLAMVSDDYGAGRSEVRIDALQPEEADASDELTPFDGSNAGVYTVELHGRYAVDGDAILLDHDGYEAYPDYVNSEEGGFDGTYTVVVTGDSATLEELRTGFEGGAATYSGSTYDSTTVSVYLEAGRMVTITGWSEDDISLSLEDAYVDDEWGGETESLTFYPSYTGEYSLEVGNLDGYVGDFELTIDTPEDLT